MCCKKNPLKERFYGMGGTGEGSMLFYRVWMIDYFVYVSVTDYNRYDPNYCICYRAADYYHGFNLCIVGDHHTKVGTKFTNSFGYGNEYNII